VEHTLIIGTYNVQRHFLCRLFGEHTEKIWI